MRTGLRFLLFMLAVLLLAAAMAAALALQTAPLVESAASVSADDVARAKDFLRRNDPRLTPPEQLRAVQVSQQELDLLLNYLASRAGHQLGLSLALHEGAAQLRGSAHWRGPLWLNLQARLVQNGGLPQVRDLRVGRLSLPDWLAGWGREYLLTRLGHGAEAQLAREMIKHVGLRSGELQLLYEWRADSYRRLMESLVPAAEQARLRAYSDRLVLLMRARTAPVSLAELLPPMFALAAERTAGGQDAAAENRAALLSLAAYASGHGLGRLVPAAREWPRARPVPVLLYSRPDFPQHLLVSAALAAEGGGPLADAIGIYKEQVDARHGSGFSFNDIAADRAGSRLGLLAVSEPLRLQQRLAAGLQERDLLPDVSDLPEYLSEAEFRQRYGGIDAPAYRKLMASIEARLEANALLR
jgi:hypothetical protein